MKILFLILGLWILDYSNRESLTVEWDIKSWQVVGSSVEDPQRFDADPKTTKLILLDSLLQEIFI